MAIYKLRHNIYATELSQHPKNNEHVLQDQLDRSNHFILAKLGDILIGFISITSPTSGTYSADKYFNRDKFIVPVDNFLFELRILSIDQTHRNGPLAYLLMYAGMRWIESHGGKNIIAICRSDLIGMYRKVGLRTTGEITRAGAVSYELSYASITDFNEWLSNKRLLFEGLIKRVDWKLPFQFFAPQPCYHGGDSFTQIGEDLQSIQTKNNVINADVLDAWFPPSPGVIKAITKNLGWLLQTSPPTQSAGLIKTIAEKRSVPETSVLPGAGSSDLIFLAFRYFLSSASRVLIIDPC